MEKSWIVSFTCHCLVVLLSQANTGLSLRITLKYMLEQSGTPQLVTSGSTVAVTGASSVQLLCRVHGGGADTGADVYWSHDDRRLTTSGTAPGASPASSSTTVKLTLSNVTAGEGGQYSCFAGQQSASLQLHVTPTLQPVPLRHVVVVGHRVDMPCAATGYPEPLVTWIMTGEHSEHFRTVVGSGSVNLTINSVIPADSGTYTCGVSNSVGSVFKQMTLVVKRQDANQGTQESISMLVKETHVPGGALIPIQKGEPLLRKPGTSFDLDCHLEPGRDSQVEISWWVNGRRFRDKSRAKVIGWLHGGLYQDHQIRFHNFTHHDGGVYVCVTSVGNVSATIAVEPIISELPDKTEVNSGEAVTLRCKAGGYPRPSVFWKHLESGALINSNVINITAVEAKDGGQYECTAHNTHGQAKAKTTLAVSEPELTFVEGAHQKQDPVVQGSRVQLSCAVQGRTDLPTTWYFSFKAQPGQTKPELLRLASSSGEELVVSENFGAAEAGNYTCVVRASGRELRRTFDIQLASPQDARKGTDAPLQHCPPGATRCSPDSSVGATTTASLLLTIAVTMVLAALQ